MQFNKTITEALDECAKNIATTIVRIEGGKVDHLNIYPIMPKSKDACIAVVDDQAFRINAKYSQLSMQLQDAEAYVKDTANKLLDMHKTAEYVNQFFDDTTQSLLRDVAREIADLHKERELPFTSVKMLNSYNEETGMIDISVESGGTIFDAALGFEFTYQFNEDKIAIADFINSEVRKELDRRNEYESAAPAL